MGRQLAAVLLILFATTSCSNSDWRTASREPAGIAPSPELVQDAVIEVYAADAFSWRGWFAVHTWLAFKEQGAKEYQVYEVVGWRVRSGLPALRNCANSGMTCRMYWLLCSSCFSRSATLYTASNSPKQHHS